MTKREREVAEIMRIIRKYKKEFAENDKEIKEVINKLKNGTYKSGY